jgi:hypothetical protein
MKVEIHAASFLPGKGLGRKIRYARLETKQTDAKVARRTLDAAMPR